MMRNTFLAVLTLAAMGAGSSALAQYKVVGPDGRVTYTDRPPTSTDAKVTPLRSAGSPAAEAAALASLPLELRQVAQRFPVVLYTTGECPPCDTARRMLRQRGVPYTERLVSSNDDLQALERLTGDRALPAMTVGTHAASGWAEGQWTELVDLAGYPPQSRLPAGYKSPVPAPLTAPKPAESTPAPPARSAPDVPAAAEPASGIRF